MWKKVPDVPESVKALRDKEPQTLGDKSRKQLDRTKTSCGTLQRKTGKQMYTTAQTTAADWETNVNNLF